MKYFWITLSLLTALTIGCNSDTSSDDPADGSASATADGGTDETIDLPEMNETELTSTNDGTNPSDDRPTVDETETSTGDQTGSSDDLPTFDEVADDTELTPEQIEVDVVQRARAALEAKDLDKALAILEEGIQKLPGNSNMAMNFVALRLQKDMQLAATDKDAAVASIKETEEAITRVMGEDAELPPQFGQMIQINQARRHAYGNDLENTMAALNKALEMGFEQFDAVMDDPFFEGIKDKEAFKTGIEQLVTKATKMKFENFESFDFDFELTDLEGNPIKLADYEGKLLIVDLWGTWCPPCRRVIPRLVSLQETYKDDSAIVGITYERHDEEDEAMAGVYKDDENREEVIQRVSEFAKEQGINYTVALGDMSTIQMAQLRGFPTMLFFDRTGKVRLKVVGDHPQEQLERYLNELL